MKQQYITINIPFHLYEPFNVSDGLLLDEIDHMEEIKGDLCGILNVLLNTNIFSYSTFSSIYQNNHKKCWELTFFKNLKGD